MSVHRCGCARRSLPPDGEHPQAAWTCRAGGADEDVELASAISRVRLSRRASAGRSCPSSTLRKPCWFIPFTGRYVLDDLVKVGGGLTLPRTGRGKAMQAGPGAVGKTGRTGSVGDDEHGVGAQVDPHGGPGPGAGRGAVSWARRACRRRASHWTRENGPRKATDSTRASAWASAAAETTTDSGGPGQAGARSSSRRGAGPGAQHVRGAVADLGAQPVAQADELGDERRGRAAVELARASRSARAGRRSSRRPGRRSRAPPPGRG